MDGNRIYVVGADPIPILTFFARVSFLLQRPEPSLLQLLRNVRERDSRHVILLIFVDCLVVLNILRKWGRDDFHPDPKEVAHFDVILPLLHELCQWSRKVRLVRMKSHTGCLMNKWAH